MTRLCTKVMVAVGLVALVAGSALAVPNPTGDTYTYTSTNLPGDDGPVQLTFDGIPEDVGSATVNEHYWHFSGASISGETYDMRGADTMPQHYTDVLPNWDKNGSIIEFSVQNNTPGAGLNNDLFNTTTVALDGLDLNNGPATPTIATNGFYFYFTEGGNPIPYQTGQLYYDTDIWVGPHPILGNSQEVYYVDFAQSDIDNGVIINLNPGSFDANYNIEREFGQPGANYSILEYVLALASDSFLGNPDIDGVGFGYLIQQLSGDGNGDGYVGGLDYLLWAGNYGTNPGPDGDYSDGDFNDDGSVDGLDYLLWAANYGSGTPPASSAVPEPGTLALAGLGAVGLLAKRRRRG